MRNKSETCWRATRWAVSWTWLVVLSLLLVNGPTLAQEDGGLLLAAPGPYAVGVRTVGLVDAQRDDRGLLVEFWYPAGVAGPDEVLTVGRDARPLAALGRAHPWPLIVFSHGNGGRRTDMAYFTAHLASYGFVVAAVDHQDPPYDDPDPAYPELTDRPLDVLYVVDRLLAGRVGDLAGLIDDSRVGVTGYSYGGFTVITLAGARIDPAGYMAHCANAVNMQDRLCMYVPAWQTISAYRARFTPLEDGDLWPPLTDVRVRAVLAMNPSRAVLMGRRGLAAAEVPTLIIAGTADTLADYRQEAVYMVEHLGAEESDLLSVLGAGHYDLADPALYGDILKHYGVAFFSAHLQEDARYSGYLTGEATAGITGVVWGAVPAEE